MTRGSFVRSRHVDVIKAMAFLLLAVDLTIVTCTVCLAHRRQTLLQHVQNILARVVAETSLWTVSSMNIHRDLHWLPYYLHKLRLII